MHFIFKSQQRDKLRQILGNDGNDTDLQHFQVFELELSEGLQCF